MKRKIIRNQNRKKNEEKKLSVSLSSSCFSSSSAERLAGEHIHRRLASIELSLCMNGSVRIGSDRIGSQQRIHYFIYQFSILLLSFRISFCLFESNQPFSNRWSLIPSTLYCVHSHIYCRNKWWTLIRHSFFLFRTLFFSSPHFLCCFFLLLFGRFWNWTRIAAW